MSTPESMTELQDRIEAVITLTCREPENKPLYTADTVSLLRDEIAVQTARAEKFKQAVIEMLENNGGPIDGFNEDGTQETSDGKDYVMVLREDFERLEAMVKEARMERGVEGTHTV